jgi:hypothetical protein
MDATIVIAAMGFAGTLVAAWLSARLHRQGDRDGRLLEVRVRSYGEFSDSLFEYARATYNRTKARLASQSEDHRERLRQEAYLFDARAPSAIGQTVILTGNVVLHERLAEAHQWHQ